MISPNKNVFTPPSKLALPLTLALIFLIGALVHYQQQTIAVVPATADENIFSGERALSHLHYLLREGQPHAMDTAANRVVESRIVERLRAMGYQEEIQDTLVCSDYERDGKNIGFSHCGQVRNIIVHIPGTVPGKGILLSSHYDSVPAAPGASDAGAAVATLLEVARLLKREPAPPRNNIVLLFNEGEEVGLFGAKALMTQHPLGKQLQVVINIEARGTTSRSVLFETGENSGWLVKHYATTTPAPLSSSLFYEIYKVLPNDTDLTVYKEHGLQGLNFAHADNEPHYHTPLDNLDNLDTGSLQHHGDNVWGVLQRIKDTDLEQVKKGNLVYTDIIGFTTVSWPESWTLWFTLLLGCLFVLGCFFLFQRRQLSAKTIVLGFTTTVLIVVIYVSLCFGAQALAKVISGHAQPWRANSLPMEVSLWSLGIFSGLLFGFWAKRQPSAVNLLIAVQLWFLVFATANALFLPGISFLFLLPLLVSLIALLFSIAFPSKVIASTLMLTALTVSAAIIFLPVAYFIEIAVGFQMSVVVGFLISFIAVSLLPLTVYHSNRTLAAFTVGLFVVALAGILWTGLQPPYTAFKPQPLNLIYLQKNGEAFLAAEAMEQYLPPVLSESLGDTRFGRILPLSNGQHHYTTTTSLNLARPRVDVTGRKETEEGQVVRLKIDTDPAEIDGITLLIPASSKLKKLERGNQRMNYEKAVPVIRDTLVYQCLGKSCAQQDLSLYFPTGENQTIVIATHRNGLPESLQTLAGKRDGLSIQRQSGDQTIVLTEVIL